MSDDKWTATTLYVLNRKVIFVEPGTAQFREIVSGQYVIGLPLKRVISDTRKDVDGLTKREDTELGKVERKRNVNHNAAVIAGTRIPVAAIKRLVEDGYDTKRILAEYPSLTTADIETAVRYPSEQHAA